MRDERDIPAAALQDENAMEMLRVWIAHKQLHCSLKVGAYLETTNIPEGHVWGTILADVTRHVAVALESGYGANRDDVVREIRGSFLKKLDSPVSGAGGAFVKKPD